jgi:serine/threonine kinase PknH
VTAHNSRIGTRFGKYQITDILGTGGMGEVYEAFDTEKNRTVALKILSDQHAHDEQFRARFLRESHAAAIIQEPHVVPIHDWGEIDGNLYIDMRLIQGATLHDLIRNEPLDASRAVLIISQVAAALDAAHADKLLHRDIKPQNIIVTPADFAYLVDFGIAEIQGDTRLTMAGTQIGSFAYMAPERFNDEPSTPATDVYSLACVLHEALTGQAPFRSSSQEQVIAGHLTAQPPRPSAINSHVSATFDAVIARGMAKEPDDRYGSAGALARAAQRALTTAGPTPMSQAHTMAAPYISTPSAGSGPIYQTPWPSTGPTVAQQPTNGDRHERNSVVPLLIIGVVAVLLLGTIGIVVSLISSKNSSQNTGVPTTITVAAPGTAQPADSPVAPAPPTTPAIPTSSTDPESASTQQLRQLAITDRPYVAAQLVDKWVPQLSAKRPGVVDDGVAWTNSLALQEHLRLRQQYNAKLLWSGDWSTFDGRNFWITIVPLTFSDSSYALAWCSNQGFDRDHCIAKIVSTTLPVAGSTALN